MAKHWTTYVGNVTDKQAYALDKMAEAHECGDGLDLLAKVNGSSRSRASKDVSQSPVTARKLIDEAFQKYGRDPVSGEAKPAQDKPMMGLALHAALADVIAGLRPFASLDALDDTERQEIREILAEHVRAV